MNKGMKKLQGKIDKLEDEVKKHIPDKFVKKYDKLINKRRQRIIKCKHTLKKYDECDYPHIFKCKKCGIKFVMLK